MLLNVGPIDESGWELMAEIGDKFHCEEQGLGSGDCMKFVNTQTGQEAVFTNPTGDGWVLDTKTATGGTFNFTNGNAYSSTLGGHKYNDIRPYEEFGSSSPNGHWIIPASPEQPLLNGSQ